MPANNDVLAGLLFVAIGLFFGVYIYATLDMGSSAAMGPGYIPVRLAGLLVILGAIIILRAKPAEQHETVPLAWRGLVSLTASVVLFGLAVDPLGLAPALTISIFLAAWAGRNMNILRALTVTAGLVLVCIVVFYWLLQTPVQLFGPWINL